MRRYGAARADPVANLTDSVIHARPPGIYAVAGHETAAGESQWLLHLLQVTGRASVFDIATETLTLSAEITRNVKEEKNQSPHSR